MSRLELMGWLSISFGSKSQTSTNVVTHKHIHVKTFMPTFPYELWSLYMALNQFFKGRLIIVGTMCLHVKSEVSRLDPMG